MAKKPSFTFLPPGQRIWLDILVCDLPRSGTTSLGSRPDPGLPRIDGQAFPDRSPFLWTLICPWTRPSELSSARTAAAFRLLIPRNAYAETSVRQSVIRLTRSLAARPYRRIHLTWPLGRLISDFSDACASGSESSARGNPRSPGAGSSALWGQQTVLAAAVPGRLRPLGQTSRNAGHLPDLIRLHRPVLASDALARLVMARLPATAASRISRNQHQRSDASSVPSP